MKNEIDHKTCKQCYLCIAICPAKYVSKDDAGNVFFIAEKDKTCIKCSQCMAICETRSIHIETLSYEKNIFKLPENNVDFENLYGFLASRRSVRNFKDKPVPKELLEKIIDALALAPYGAEPNNVEFTVINNRAIIEKALPAMSEFYDKVENWLDSAFMRFMIKKKKGMETFNTLNNHLLTRIKVGHYKIKPGVDNITRHAPTLIILHAKPGAEEHTDDSRIYLTYAFLAAHALGLGATIIGLVPPPLNKSKELKQLFKIPVENEVITSLVVGYPKYHFKNGIRREKTMVTWID